MRHNGMALSAALLAAALAAAGEPAVAQTTETARVDALFSEWDRADGPGAAVAVLRDGEVVLERGYGSAQVEHRAPITPSTIFHVASVTKQFTTFAIALLASRGALSLDDDVRAHIPELPDPGHRVTLRHLVHHTSGVRDQWELLAMAGWRLDDVITKDQILALAVRQRELNFEPGTEHLYSNMGYTLLAEVVERVTGEPFPAWMQANVFAPLGMSATHMHDDHEHVVPGRAYSYRGSPEQGWRNAVLSYANAGATSLFTTAGDLARWLRNFETAELGGPAVVEMMRERAVLNGTDTIPYAFAIVRGEHRGRTTWSHGGADAGFRSTVLHVPDERLGVVVLSNDASFLPARLAAAVADIYLGETGPVGEPDPAAGPVLLSTRLLEAYAGRWEVDEVGTVVLRRVGGGLVAERDAERVPLRPESDSTFFLDADRLRFQRSPAGVDHLVVERNGKVVPGRRVRPDGLGAAELTAYAGDYFSPELETVYRLAVVDGTLVARHVRHGDITLEPVDHDLFAGSAWFLGRLAFERDDAGAIDGFRATAGRVRDLRFVRLPDGALPDRP